MPHEREEALRRRCRAVEKRRHIFWIDVFALCVQMRPTHLAQRPCRRGDHAFCRITRQVRDKPTDEHACVKRMQ